MIAACTIVSKNYISFARTLCKSFKKNNPNYDFYVLLVDKNLGEIDPKQEDFILLEVDDLGIKNFEALAFMFNVLELNTNVKPTFIKYLFKNKKYEKVVYFDPDIYIYSNLSEIIQLLSTHSIIITPHILSPYPIDNYKPNEQDLLQCGIYNLGFIALNNCYESIKFLNWWEEKCFKLGFNERKTGLFVDQKWINFINCFCNKVYILKQPEYNVAYWNLHERILKFEDNKWKVNNCPLNFYHFSGIIINDNVKISKYLTRYDLENRPEMVKLIDEYKKEIVNNGFYETKKIVYYYSMFSNGEVITQLSRSLYSQVHGKNNKENPFDINSSFYKWARKAGIIGEKDTQADYNLATYNKRDRRLVFLNFLFRLILKIFGVDKYTLLMKYLSYISVLRNQRDIFKI